MQLTPQEIEHVARLARLDLSQDEKEQYAKELSSVFDYFEMLQEVDTSLAVDLQHKPDRMNVVRADVSSAAPKDLVEALIAAFPEKEGRLLKVKAVFDDDRYAAS